MKNKQIDFEDAFIKEVDEDLKNESMRKFWEKYGLYIMILVVGSLSLAVSYESVKAWYKKRAENWSNSYAVALSLQGQQRYDESIDTLDFISGKDYGIYVDLAKLQKANVLFDAKRVDEAIAVLEEIRADKNFNAPLKETAIVKLASYKVDTASAQEIKEILGELATNEKSSWYPLANDLLAMVALRDNNTEEAMNIFNQLLQNEKTPDEVKDRIKNIISLI